MNAQPIFLNRTYTHDLENVNVRTETILTEKQTKQTVNCVHACNVIHAFQWYMLMVTVYAWFSTCKLNKHIHMRGKVVYMKNPTIHLKIH